MMFETKTRMIKIISMVMMGCRMRLLLKTSPEADDGGLGGGGDDMRAADRFFLPPLPTGTTAKYLHIFISIYIHIYIKLYSCRHYQHKVKTSERRKYFGASANLGDLTRILCVSL